MKIKNALTGVYNRRQFDNFIRNKINKFSARKFLAGIMIDVDNFKKINDQYGHVVGDNILENIDTILKKSEDRMLPFI